MAAAPPLTQELERSLDSLRLEECGLFAVVCGVLYLSSRPLLEEQDDFEDWW